MDTICCSNVVNDLRFCLDMSCCLFNVIVLCTFEIYSGNLIHCDTIGMEVVFVDKQCSSLHVSRLWISCCRSMSSSPKPK